MDHHLRRVEMMRSDLRSVARSQSARDAAERVNKRIEEARLAIAYEHGRALAWKAWGE